MPRDRAGVTQVQQQVVATVARQLELFPRVTGERADLRCLDAEVVSVTRLVLRRHERADVVHPACAREPGAQQLVGEPVHTLWPGE